MPKEKLSKRMWVSLILIGLVGQFAWTIENMYFNVFLYNTISTDPRAIAAMVAASAAAATVTTLLMGALSDRVGRRKPFICAGYVLWGISTMAFGFISVEGVAAWAGTARAASIAVALVIVMDCVMTFFGSTANDAAFNAYITDNTAPENRGRVESALATLPLISMLVIFGGFDGLTQQGRWREFFLIFGGLVTVTGVLACFLLRETPREKKKGNYLSGLLHGFRPLSLTIACRNTIIKPAQRRGFHQYACFHACHGEPNRLKGATAEEKAQHVFSGSVSNRCGTVTRRWPRVAL